MPVAPPNRIVSLGATTHRFETTTSTNDEAAKRARAGAPEGEVFIANMQTAGRGRAGRSWASLPIGNLYISFLLRPSIPNTDSTLLTEMAAVAVYETVASLLTPKKVPGLSIKWPNDIYVGDQKIAGMLIETETQGNQIQWAVVGIGLNINAARDDFPSVLRDIVTSLRILLGYAVERDVVVSRLIEKLEGAYKTLLDGKGIELVAFCNQHSYLNGKTVTVTGFRDKPFTAIVKGLDTRGSLVVIEADGCETTVFTGDVTVRPA